MPIEWGSGKFKVMLFHFAANKIYLFVFLFEFTHLKVPCSKIQKGGNFKFFFLSVSCPIIFNLALHILIDVSYIFSGKTLI